MSIHRGNHSKLLTKYHNKFHLNGGQRFGFHSFLHIYTQSAIFQHSSVVLVRGATLPFLQQWQWEVGGGRRQTSKNILASLPVGQGWPPPGGNKHHIFVECIFCWSIFFDNLYFSILHFLFLYFHAATLPLAMMMVASFLPVWQWISYFIINPVEPTFDAVIGT